MAAGVNNRPIHSKANWSYRLWPLSSN